MTKPYYRYNKDKKILSSAPMRALENKIKSGTSVGRGTMAKMAKREYEENGDAIREAQAEQIRLKAARQFRKKSNMFKRNVPEKLRKEWGERMNHLRSIK